MRNWNMTNFKNLIFINKCFHFTYEELKQLVNIYHNLCFPIPFPLYLWGIETRRNLRFLLYSRFQFPLYLWGIETKGKKVLLVDLDRFHFTYEELKHIRFSSALTVLNVSTLPMRNWNYDTDATRFTIDMVSTLPMRNWNDCRTTQNIWRYIVSTLSMRNWN